MKVLVLTVHAVGEHDGTMGCDYAVVDLDAAKARFKRLIALASKVQKEVEALKSLAIWDSTPTIISQANAIKIAGDEVIEKMESHSYAVVEATSINYDEAIADYERTECIVLHASDGDIYWEFYPKHTTVACETAAVPLAGLK
jgi:hypothetical protein